MLQRMKASITTVLAVVFGVLVLTVGGTILQVGVRTGLESAEELTADKVVLILDAVANRLRVHLAPALQITERLAELVSQGAFDPENGAALAIALESARAGSPQIRSVLFVDSSGQATGSHAATFGRTIQVDDWSRRQDVLRVLESLRQSGESIWGPPVYVPEPDVVVLNARAPAFRAGQFVGIFVATVGVDQLSRHLASLPARALEVPFVLSGRDEVVAHPSLVRPWNGRSVDAPLAPLAAIEDPVLRNLWHEPSTRGVGRVTLPPGNRSQITRVGGADGEGDYVVVTRQEHGFGESPWLVGVHFPRETIGGQLMDVVKAAIIGLIVLLAAAVGAVVIAARVSRPIRRLADAATHLTEEGPEGVEILPNSRFVEVNAANAAFNHMVEGLRERELIRDLFGRFVPEEVARSLVADRGNLAPRTVVATVFFSDIAGFSTLAEDLEPEPLIKLLNEYFELLGNIIGKHHGAIQQFQGDAILATFNLPIPDRHHASNAIRAALAIQRALAGRTFGDGRALPTRIGINTGTMVGGTVGSDRRKGYTVHGDDVNLAARIEELNKQYGTSLLVSETTVEQADPSIRFEAIGEVPIRGRSRPARLYGVLSD